MMDFDDDAKADAVNAINQVDAVAIREAALHVALGLTNSMAEKLKDGDVVATEDAIISTHDEILIGNPDALETVNVPYLSLSVYHVLQQLLVVGENCAHLV